nr:hypothetical protein [uncultured Ottowia sp.]
MPAHRLAFSQSAARWLLNGLLGGLLASLAAGACAAPALSAEPAECTAIDESALEQAEAQWTREAAQALREHAKALAARGDSRSLLMAMYVMRAIDADPLDQSQSASDSDKQRQLYLQAVREGQSAEPVALWLSQGLCAGKKTPADKPGAAAQPGEFRGLQADCDPQALLERLAQQEPDNAAPWLALAAQHPEGSAGREQALQRAAEAPKALFYERRLGPLLHEAFQHVAWPEPPKQLEVASLFLPDSFLTLNEKERISDTYAVGLWAAVPYHGVMEMRQMCGQGGPAGRKPPAAVTTPLRQQQCRAIAARVAAEPDNLVLRQTVALSLLVQLTEGEPQQARWKEELRQRRWLMEGWLPNYTDKYDLRATLLRPETEVMRQRLREAGQPETAPAGWLPLSERKAASGKAGG